MPKPSMQWGKSKSFSFGPQSARKSPSALTFIILVFATCIHHVTTNINTKECRCGCSNQDNTGPHQEGGQVWLQATGGNGGGADQRVCWQCGPFLPSAGGLAEGAPRDR
eukprot:7550416-Karenia_brevis.AAC.1